MQSDSTLVLLPCQEEPDYPEIQNIKQYGDGDEETITRARGGVVQAIINKRDDCKNKIHYVLPIKNNDNKARFLYRQSLETKQSYKI